MSVGVSVCLFHFPFSVIHVGMVVVSVHLVCVVHVGCVTLYVHIFGAVVHFLSRVCWRWLTHKIATKCDPPIDHHSISNVTNSQFFYNVIAHKHMPKTNSVKN